VENSSTPAQPCAASFDAEMYYDGLEEGRSMSEGNWTDVATAIRAIVAARAQPFILRAQREREINEG
jgi:hypothetical protein